MTFSQPPNHEFEIEGVEVEEETTVTQRRLGDQESTMLGLRSGRGTVALSKRFLSTIIPKPFYNLEEAIARYRDKTKNNQKLTFNVCVKLNLDYRVKTNRMKGTFDLPHGAAKQGNIAALTYNDELKVAALLNGAVIAGDLAFRYKIQEMTSYMDYLDRVVATTDMEVEFQRPGRFRSKMKKQKLIPCFEYKTLVSPDDFAETIYKHVNGFYRPYVTTHHGNVTTNIGRMRQDDSEIEANLNYVLEHLFENRPDDFGTGPSRKKKNIGIFVLGMHLMGGRGFSIPLDLESFPILREKNVPPPKPHGIRGQARPFMHGVL